jgi:hypothetical protein
MAFRELILHNFRRKLFALLLAILIWLTIRFASEERSPGGRGNQQSQTNSLSIE